MATHALGQSKIKQECARKGGAGREGKKGMGGGRRGKKKTERRGGWKRGTLQIVSLNVGRIRNLIISA